ncbi:MAG: hypothetical protein H0V65_00265 [Chitinophagales bacterium]|nr:hypothetical protein [Chitinophagales bacterium]
MLLRLLEIPLIDILLIVLAIRYIWPGIFGIKSRKQRAAGNSKDKIFHPENSSPISAKYSKEQGEYIDYEEIK